MTLVTHLQDFGSDQALADIQIRIQNNLEIRIQIADHFRLRLDAWRRFALSQHSLVMLQIDLHCSLC